MARIELTLPEQFYYKTSLTVRMTDLNIGNHVGNDQMIGLLSEARFRFFHHFGMENIQAEGLNILVTDIMATYKAPAFGRDVLTFEVGVMDFNKYGGDIIFRVSRPPEGRIIVFAKTGFVFVQSKTGKITSMPDQFRNSFPDI